MSEPNSHSASKESAADTDSQSDLAAVQKTQLQALVDRSQKVMASAWMVRTFIKHSDEVDDFPELNEMARTIFDTYRALETQITEPASYFKVVRKKLSKLRQAATQFQKDAWHASTHTNFQQAAVTALFIGEQLEEILSEAERFLPRMTPPKISLPTHRGIES